MRKWPEVLINNLGILLIPYILYELLSEKFWVDDIDNMPNNPNIIKYFNRNVKRNVITLKITSHLNYLFNSLFTVDLHLV